MYFSKVRKHLRHLFFSSTEGGFELGRLLAQLNLEVPKAIGKIHDVEDLLLNETYKSFTTLFQDANLLFGKWQVGWK